MARANKDTKRSKILESPDGVEKGVAGDADEALLKSPGEVPNPERLSGTSNRFKGAFSELFAGHKNEAMEILPEALDAVIGNPTSNPRNFF